MSNPFLIGLYGLATIYFSFFAIKILPILLLLISELLRGNVNWPGPVVRDRKSKTSIAMRRIGIRPDHLFPAFSKHALSLLAVLTFSILSLLSQFVSNVVPRDGMFGVILILSLLALYGGFIAGKNALHNSAQIRILLSDKVMRVEPRHVDSHSQEDLYSIEHPLVENPYLPPITEKALNLYLEALATLNSGDRTKGNLLNQEALSICPNLHEQLYDHLSNLADKSRPSEAGAICYWLGIHSENRRELQQAASWYAKAAIAFESQGYRMRQGRASCNHGSVQLKLGEFGHGVQSFKRAIELNPKDGIAHFNLGMLYYRGCDPGDEKHNRALEAFAAAIAADPEVYGPTVAARMRSHAYEWKEDLEEVMRRVTKKTAN